MLGSVQALAGEGHNVRAVFIGNRLRPVEHVSMPPGGPLTGGIYRCRAVVHRTRDRGSVYRTLWYWNCFCGEMGYSQSWSRAYRASYRHVRLNWLLDAVAELELEEDCE